MAVATTDTKALTPLELEALAVRTEAAHRLLPRCMTPDDRLDLLAAVVWPSHPLVGLTSSTSSDTGSS